MTGTRTDRDTGTCCTSSREIYGRYAKNPLVRIKADSGGVRGGPWSVKYPIKWVTQQEDTHPHYFGAMSLKFEAPAVRQEVPFT